MVLFVLSLRSTFPLFCLCSSFWSRRVDKRAECTSYDWCDFEAFKSHFDLYIVWFYFQSCLKKNIDLIKVLPGLDNLKEEKGSWFFSISPGGRADRKPRDAYYTNGGFLLIDQPLFYLKWHKKHSLYLGRASLLNHCHPDRRIKFKQRLAVGVLG